MRSTIPMPCGLTDWWPGLVLFSVMICAFVGLCVKVVVDAREGKVYVPARGQPGTWVYKSNAPIEFWCYVVILLIALAGVALLASGILLKILMVRCAS